MSRRPEVVVPVRVIGGWEQRIEGLDTTVIRFLPAPSTAKEAWIWAGGSVLVAGRQRIVCRVRAELGWTLQEMADAMDVDPEDVAEWECATGTVPYDVAGYLRALERG